MFPLVASPGNGTPKASTDSLATLGTITCLFDLCWAERDTTLLDNHAQNYKASCCQIRNQSKNRICKNVLKHIAEEKCTKQIVFNWAF